MSQAIFKRKNCVNYGDFHQVYIVFIFYSGWLVAPEMLISYRLFITYSGCFVARGTLTGSHLHLVI